MMKNKLLACLLAATGAAQAAITLPAQEFSAFGSGTVSGNKGGAALVVDLAGTASIDALNDALNVRWSVDAAPGALVDAVGYQLLLATVGESWLSEATVLISNSAGHGVMLRPGYSQDTDGIATFSGSASLVALNMAFNVGSDGKLNFQFYEHYDDFAGSADALFTGGHITFANLAPVPEPTTAGLLALGLAALSLRRRRQP